MAINQDRSAVETRKWLMAPSIVAVLAIAQASFTSNSIFWLFSVIIGAAAIGKIIYVLFVSRLFGSIHRVLDDQ